MSYVFPRRDYIGTDDSTRILVRFKNLVKKIVEDIEGEGDLSIETLYFSGEMVYPFFFDAHRCLREFKDIAKILVGTAWEQDMYGIDSLKNSTVPTNALIWVLDMLLMNK